MTTATTASAAITSLRYADAPGGEPAVVLLHAFPLHSGMWEPQLRSLSPRHRVIAPDLRGFGRAEAPADPGGYTMAGYSDEVVALLDRLDIDRAVVVGLSMGGYVAFSLLRHHPGRLAGLVLADTRAGADSADVKERRTLQQRQVREHGTTALIETLLEGLLAEETRRRRPEVVSLTRQLMDNPSTGFVGALEAMKARPDSTPLLAGIAVPTLVVVGAEDRLTPPAVAEEMQLAVPASKLAVLQGAGHLSNLEAPEGFNSAVAGFLSSQEADW